ncbi:hypothetical protein, partial [Pseudoxanthomonas suwonensis]|uniref:hypothetical protein n=1 Tax=Pseudoxanthomonas suwonensis TaxID=314722 RepID=UPI001E4FAFB5
MRVGESCACRHRQRKSNGFDARQLRREPRSAGAPGMNEGAGDVWRVATRLLPHRIHSSLLES